MMIESLQIQNISKHFDGIKAVDGVSFTLNQAFSVGIYGDNGAGKTTLFNLISGFEFPDTGNVILNGKDITRENVLNRAKMGMGRLFQNPRVFNEVTVLDNLLAASKNDTAHHLINYLVKRERIRTEDKANMDKAYKILDDFSLSTKAQQKAYELSIGEKKLLSLGCLIMNDAKLILLDEPFTGINPNMIDKIIHILQDMKRTGHTFIVIEHNYERMMSFIDQVYKMFNVKVVAV